MKRTLRLLALMLICLLVLTACGRGGQQGNPPDDPVGGGQQSGNESGSGNGGSGGSGNESGTGNESGSGGTEQTKTTVLGEINGVTYQLVEFLRTQSDNDATRFQLCAVGGDVLFATAGDLDYAEGSLEASGNAALYFTASTQEGGAAALYCYDLYSKTSHELLAAPCSNMVVFEGDLSGYGWLLQDDYIMPVNLKTQMADMSMAVSIAELPVFANVGSSFFADGRTVSVKESERGVLEIALTQGSTMEGYLYTCDTFTAVKLK